MAVRGNVASSSSELFAFEGNIHEFMSPVDILPHAAWLDERSFTSPSSRVDFSSWTPIWKAW